MTPASWIRSEIDVPGGRVAAWTLGDGERTILLLHGGPGCPSRYLRDSHQFLARKGWRVATWDQLGCGESGRPADPRLWTLPRFVAETDAVRAALGTERVDLLGHSWGGVLALEYLLAHPNRVRTLVGVATAFDLPRMQRGFERAKQALGDETCRMMASHEAEGTTSHPEYQAAVTILMHRHVCRVTWPDSLGWCLANLGVEVFATLFGPYFFQCSGTLRSHDRTEALASVQCPTLFVHGEHDYITPELACSARDRVRGAELFLARACSHMPFFEAPGPYQDRLGSFLAAH